jgi:Tfp pilus assembly protein PilO
MKKISLGSLSKRQQIEKSASTVVLAMAVAAFIVSFSLVTMNFLWGLSGHHRRVIAEKSEARGILEQNVENIEPLQTNFNVFEAGDVKSDTVLDALPSKYDFPALATTMESLVRQSGMTLESFAGDDNESTAVQEETQPVPVEMEFVFAVEGTYSELQDLISSMERTIRPLQIKDMEIKGSDDAIKATMRVITFYQPATTLEVETRTVQ